ncbi:MAG: hypothetical protein HQK65_01080 [Desulfamplus sp.]|nr:hypothetical protein [Desulfamplus sp.]
MLYLKKTYQNLNNKLDKENIEYRFESEVKFEYISASIALGRYARDEESLKKKLFNYLGKDEQKNALHASNRHLKRHALIALPAYCGKDEQKNDIDEERNAIRRFFEWMCFCEAIQIFLDDDKTFKFQKFNDKYADFLEKFINRAHEYYKKQESDRNKYLLRLLNNNVGINARQRIERIVYELNTKITFCGSFIKKIEELKNQKKDFTTYIIEGATAILSKIINENVRPPTYEDYIIYYPDDKTKIPEILMTISNDAWRQASLNAGISEALSDHEMMMDYILGIVINILKSSNPKPELILNFPWLLYHFLQNKSSSKGINILLQNLEKCIPYFFKSTSLDSIFFITELAETRCFLQHDDQNKILRESIRIMKENIKLKVEWLELINSFDKSLLLFNEKSLEDNLRFILTLFKSTICIDSKWNMLSSYDQKVAYTLIGFFVLHCSNFNNFSGMFRKERLLDYTISVIDQIKGDDDKEQFFMRLLKEQFRNILSASNQSEEYIIMEWAYLQLFLIGWNFKRTVAKDIGISVSFLMEAAFNKSQTEKSPCKSILTEIVVLGEYSHIDKQILTQSSIYMREESIKTYLEKIIEIEEKFDNSKKKFDASNNLNFIKEEVDTIKEKYKEAIKIIDKSNLYKIPNIIDFLSVQDQVEISDWNSKYQEGLKHEIRQSLEKLVSIKFHNLFYFQHKIKFIDLKDIDGNRGRQHPFFQEKDEFKLKQSIEINNVITDIDRTLLNICRLLREVRIFDLDVFDDRQISLRELQTSLSSFKTWCHSNLPYILVYPIIFYIDQLLQDVDNHREISSMIRSAMLHKNGDALDKAKIFLEEDKKLESWGKVKEENTIKGEYGQLIDEVRVKIAISHEDQTKSEEEVIKILEDIDEPLKDQLLQWMFSRFMFREIAEEMSKDKKNSRVEIFFWKIYPDMINVLTTIIICACPYLIYGISFISEVYLGLIIPTWLPGIGFSAYFCGFWFLVIFIFWKTISILKRREPVKRNKSISAVSMIYPKIFGILLIVSTPILLTDEGLKLGVEIKPLIAFFLIITMVCLQFIFIREVLIKYQKIDPIKKTKRASALFSIILLDSYFFVLFISSFWGESLLSIERLKDISSHWPVWIPERLDLHIYDLIPLSCINNLFPPVYPGPVLFWTVQLGFIGIVLNHYLSITKIFEKEEG